uniref:Uncharacterized protein n=1 Tax=uncultured bacterium contig00407 TaxID=1181629 RepID=A0A806KL08_9BACT|nr:hypothetical protein [uncultured bacterium contig00407]
MRLADLRRRWQYNAIEPTRHATRRNPDTDHDPNTDGNHNTRPNTNTDADLH